jgi:hypothetical protein
VAKQYPEKSALAIAIAIAISRRVLGGSTDGALDPLGRLMRASECIGAPSPPAEIASAGPKRKKIHSTPTGENRARGLEVSRRATSFDSLERER